MVKRILVVLFTLSWCMWLSAQTLHLKANHPTQYVVKKGDTLWGISAKFLQHPWQWPKLWRSNPQIKNPHLIYPGDELQLSLVNGKPVLSIEKRTVKLSPKVRTSSSHEAIPTVPYSAIKPFLVEHGVFSKTEFNEAPYVVALQEQQLAAAEGNKIYVRRLLAPLHQEYAIYRMGEKYVDPITKENLGYAAIRVGDAKLIESGDPAVLKLVSSGREIVVGDRLFPMPAKDQGASFTIRQPSFEINGQIIAVMNGITQIGQYNVVVINRGSNGGIKKGDVLAVQQQNRVVKDTIDGGKVKIKGDRVGELLIFRVFPRVSYGLVMRATKPIHTLDIVTNMVDKHHLMQAQSSRGPYKK